MVDISTASSLTIVAYLATGMENSAPFAIEAGQRCMIDFCLV